MSCKILQNSILRTNSLSQYRAMTSKIILMPCSGILRRVALVRKYVSEESIASVIRVRRIGELGTTLTLTSNRSTLRRNMCHIVFQKTWLGSSREPSVDGT
jgi:hypothetical protein